MEGKAYKASFKVRIGDEVIESVGDAHLVIAAAVKNKYDDLIESPDRQRILGKDFATFAMRVETMLPSFTVR